MMALVQRDEEFPIAEYEKVRPDFCRRMMLVKKDRIVQVGDHATFHFESHDTMLYQVLEMMRAENLVEERLHEEEIHAYNPVVPQKNELSVTLMLEYVTPEERAEVLPRFVGIDQHVFLKIGDTKRVLATLDAEQIAEDKMSSVQYTKFHLTDKQVAELQKPGTVLRAIMTHPYYTAEAVLGENVRRAIQDDPL